MADDLAPDVLELVDAEPWLRPFAKPEDTAKTLRARYNGAQRTYTRTRSVPARLRKGAVRTTTIDQTPSGAP